MTPRERTNALLLEGAAILDDFPREITFDYTDFGRETECGTIACAAGSIAILGGCGLGADWRECGGDIILGFTSDQPGLTDNNTTTFKFLAKHFGITDDEAAWLFAGWGYRTIDGYYRSPRVAPRDVTAQHIAGAMRELAERYA